MYREILITSIIYLSYCVSCTFAMVLLSQVLSCTMDKILKERFTQEKLEKRAGLRLEAERQLQSDWIAQQNSIGMFPNSQIVNPQLDYNTMREDMQSLREQAGGLASRVAFVEHLQRWLTSNSAEKVAQKFESYENAAELFTAAGTYDMQIKKYIEGEQLQKYTMNIIMKLVLKYLESKGVKPEGC
jgi:hypothetical protein